MALPVKLIAPVLVILIGAAILHSTHQPELDLPKIAQDINRAANLPLEPMQGLRIEPVQAVGKELVIRYILTESEDITLPENASTQMQTIMSASLCGALKKFPTDEQEAIKAQNVGFYAKVYNRKDVFLSSVRVNTSQC